MFIMAQLPSLQQFAFHALIKKHYLNNNQKPMIKDLALLKTFDNPVIDSLIKNFEKQSWLTGKILSIKTTKTDAIVDHILDIMYKELIQPIDIPNGSHPSGTLADDIEYEAINKTEAFRSNQFNLYVYIIKIHHPDTWRKEAEDLNNDIDAVIMQYLNLN